MTIFTKHLAESLHAIFSKQEKKHPFFSFQQKIWDKLWDQGLPTKKTYGFENVSFGSLYENDFIFADADSLSNNLYSCEVFPECKERVLFFGAGTYLPAFSSITGFPPCSLLSFGEASRKFRTFLHNRFQRVAQEEKDFFALLNYALGVQGAFFYIPASTKIELPIQISLENIIPNIFNLPRLHLIVGEKSQVELILFQKGRESSFTHSLFDITLEPEAQLKISFIEECDSSSSHFCDFRVHLKEKSRFSSLSSTKGGLISRHRYHVCLEGQESECSLSGVWSLDEKRQHHVHTTVVHQAPHCHSMQKFKGVLHDFTRSSFEGKIMVDPCAMKTQAYQVNNNLLLSEKAFATSKPNLEILADDVKASHGATFGQIDEAHLFYLISRGLTLDEAKQLLIVGYGNEIIQQMNGRTVQAKALSMFG